jgi:hypothetical protein
VPERRELEEAIGPAAPVNRGIVRGTLWWRSLKAHLGDGNPNAWRAALRVVEHQLGRPKEHAEPAQTIDVCAMTPEQRKTAIARMVEEHPGLAALIPRAPGVCAEP